MARGDQASKATAGLILGAIEAVAVARYRVESARMTAPERGMIEPPLVAFLSKLPVKQRDRLATMAGPITFFIGMSMYVQRLAKLEREKRAVTDEQRAVDEADKLTRPVQSSAPTTGSNGVRPTGEQPGGSIPPEAVDGDVPPARTDVIRQMWSE